SGRGSVGGGRGGSAKNKKAEDFSWERDREEVLSTLRVALGADMSRLWSQGIPETRFVGLFFRLACRMLETPLGKAGRTLAMELVSVPFCLVRGVESEVCAAVFSLLREHGEHLAAPIAEMCLSLAVQDTDVRLPAELLREIGRMDMSGITR
ncbi:unnamed protein product, partial [Discosporangium mesarthrocarpum]